MPRNTRSVRPASAAVSAAINFTFMQQPQIELSRRTFFNWSSHLSQLPLLLGLFGGAVLAGGAEAPLIHIPIVGTISYLHHPSYFNACSIGEIIIPAAAGLSVGFALLKRFKMLWLSGTVAVAQLIATLVIFQHDAATVVTKANQPDLVDPALMWAGSALQHARLEWGIAVVAGGAVIVLAAAAWDQGVSRKDRT